MDCGCFTRFNTPVLISEITWPAIIFCPLHEAAAEMLDTLFKTHQLLKLDAHPSACLCDVALDGCGLADLIARAEGKVCPPKS